MAVLAAVCVALAVIAALALVCPALAAFVADAAEGNAAESAEPPLEKTAPGASESPPPPMPGKGAPSSLANAETWQGPGAFQRALRSALFPAWGQIVNGKHRKAALLFSVHTYLYTRIFIETHDGREARRRANRLEAEGDTTGLAELEHVSADDHFETRRDLLFWTIVTAFYGAIDAYVDAHLQDFDQELEEGRGLFGAVDPIEGELALGVHF
jgi:hypothetical protein